MKLFWPEKPCQPSVPNQNGGSIRPVEPPAVSPGGQSALAQYLAPGTRKLAGTETCSAVFAIISPIPEFPHRAVGGVALGPHGLPLVHGVLSQIGSSAAAEPDRRRQAIDQHVVPLVEDGDSPITIGKTGEGELTIRVALGKGEILAVSIAQAHIALGEGEAAVV